MRESHPLPEEDRNLALHSVKMSIRHLEDVRDFVSEGRMWAALLSLDEFDMARLCVAQILRAWLDQHIEE